MTTAIRYLALYLSVFFILSCTDNVKEKTVLQDMIAKTNSKVQQKTVDKGQSVFQKLIWTTDFDTVRRDFVLIKNREVNADTLTSKKVIDEINSVQGSIFLHFNKVSHDTIYVSIPDSYYLTERIGTFGANEYMASTTYSLTELKGIKYVHYDFEEGEHLSPGTMTRDDYKNYR